MDGSMGWQFGLRCQDLEKDLPGDHLERSWGLHEVL
jgi:hypothetical protein